MFLNLVQNAAQRPGDSSGTDSPCHLYWPVLLVDRSRPPGVQSTLQCSLPSPSQVYILGDLLAGLGGEGKLQDVELTALQADILHPATKKELMGMGEAALASSRRWGTSHNMLEIN